MERRDAPGRCGCFAYLALNDAPVVSEPTLGQPDRNAVFTTSLSAKSGRTVTVQYSASDGTAIAGDDYTAAAGTVTFPAGSRTRMILVPVRGDGISEGNENFVVILSSPVNAALTDSRGVCAIAD
ncbi:MAG TPA: Calx-beta domain-containing protein [Abditibacteriaceae bacterium]|nr:Calx-beta domain-containing protein [Abditibacteriaceae bacterium]